MSDGPAVPAAAAQLTGPRVYRIHWVPGTDALLAVCHCGAERDFPGPVELWDWLLAHPDGHAAALPSPGSHVREPATASA